MEKRKDLPVGLGPITESMIDELEFHFRINGHELIRKMVRDLHQPVVEREFIAFLVENKIKKIEKSIRIRGFKFPQSEIEELSKWQWKCRIKGISTFIKQLIYFNYEKHIEKK